MIGSLTSWWGAVLEAPDAHALAQFYADLLGWKIAKSEPGWTAISSGSGTAYLAFQTSPEYIRPVWPAQNGGQQMMMHIDVGVRDLDEAVAASVALGGVVADFQPQQDVRVLLDPAGHPFCLYVDVD